MMTITRQNLLFLVLLGVSFLCGSHAFAPPAAAFVSSRSTAHTTPSAFVSSSKTTQLHSLEQAAAAASSSSLVSTTTLDPTTFFSDIMGGLINTPAILAVPIVAALGVAGTLGWLIFKYADPVVEDDEV
jgi:hypothetical protein